MCIGILPGCVCEPHAILMEARRGHLDLLELELQRVVSCPLVTGNITWFLWKSSQCSESSLQPPEFNFQASFVLCVLCLKNNDKSEYADEGASFFFFFLSFLYILFHLRLTSKSSISVVQGTEHVSGSPRMCKTQGTKTDMHVIPALGKQRQEDQEAESTLPLQRAISPQPLFRDFFLHGFGAF